MSKRFENWSNSDVVELIETYPFAWIVSNADRFRATPLPILLETNEQGAPISLVGHFAVSNPQVEAVTADSSALFLFMGPHGYISPSMAGRTNWGPTWNYAALRIEAEIDLDPKLNDEVVARLVRKMERDHSPAWSADQLGERYNQLIQRIIAFRAPIRRIDARFKLGQDESDDVLSAIVESLAGNGLAHWMQSFNVKRGAAKSDQV
ncbi:FMN-binding negative transcriptional regulator [Tsuneonella mangrovi]|uniref:FMN-binding negative transcriptional regulator n=1 Tax=Tsuneonella mangrovi TaxID=1982042 RepID=UPI00196B7647|nr:FMN-binding negative transcriptional regulator [Tsuneonella mangrovi]